MLVSIVKCIVSRNYTCARGWELAYSQAEVFTLYMTELMTLVRKHCEKTLPRTCM